jgi:hypothetical protein
MELLLQRWKISPANAASLPILFSHTKVSQFFFPADFQVP